jgi:hypothetical protein
MTGKQGKQGPPGKNGKDGKDGGNGNKNKQSCPPDYAVDPNGQCQPRANG